MWFCLRGPVFSRFIRTPTCGRHRQTRTQAPVASTAHAQHRAVKTDKKCYITKKNEYLRLFAAVTLLLALSVYQIIVSDKLPSSSTSVPIIGRYNFLETFRH